LAPERPRYEPVARVVGVLVRTTRPVGTHPGQRADRGHIRRSIPHRPEPAWSGDRVGEVVAPERGEHVGDQGAVAVVPDGQLLVASGGEPLCENGDYLAVPAGPPQTQLRYVIGHPDDQHPAAGRRSERGEDRVEVRLGLWYPDHQAPENRRDLDPEHATV